MCITLNLTGSHCLSDFLRRYKSMCARVCVSIAMQIARVINFVFAVTSLFYDSRIKVRRHLISLERREQTQSYWGQSSFLAKSVAIFALFEIFIFFSRFSWIKTFHKL